MFILIKTENSQININFKRFVQNCLCYYNFHWSLIIIVINLLMFCQADLKDVYFLDNVIIIIITGTFSRDQSLFNH